MKWKWTPSIAYACVILAFTSVPGDYLLVPEPFDISDKWVHAALYLPLGALAFGALSRGHRPLSLWRRSFYTLIVCAAFAALDECHQLFIPGRFGDVLDWLADTIGVAAGTGLSLACIHWRRPVEPEAEEVEVVLDATAAPDRHD